MSGLAGGDDAARAWNFAALEIDRARRAAAVAIRHEELAAVGGTATRHLHQRMAAIHRQMEQRHLVTARLYGSLRTKLQGRHDSRRTDDTGPALMSATAELAGSNGAVLALIGSDHCEVLVVASDTTARHVYDLEFQFGEGPCLDAVRTRSTVTALGQDLTVRWQFYGPAAARLNVRAVAAAPMKLGARCVGALTLIDPSPGARSGAVAELLGSALAHSVIDGQAGGPHGPLLRAGDHRPAVRQAAGIVSVRDGCSVVDALALIRARAFADGRTVDQVARDILSGLVGA